MLESGQESGALKEAGMKIESALVQNIVEAVLQINGKVKEKIKVAANITKNEFEKLALENEQNSISLQGLGRGLN